MRRLRKVDVGYVDPRTRISASFRVLRRRASSAQRILVKWLVSSRRRRMCAFIIRWTPPLGVYPSLRLTSETESLTRTTSASFSSVQDRRGSLLEPTPDPGMCRASTPSRAMCRRRWSYLPGLVPSRRHTSANVALAATASASCSSVHRLALGMR